MKVYDELLDKADDSNIYVVHIFSLMGLFIVSILKLIIYNSTK